MKKYVVKPMVSLLSLVLSGGASFTWV